MDFRTFERVAHDVYASIPEQFLEGVEGLEVSRKTVPHPTLPDIYTLGECITESFPGEYEVRSVVALYYGSFRALSRLDAEWDWEEEIYETVTHEVQHHRESMALDESLEELDYAEDQNFARHEGHPFDPQFYRSGARLGPTAWEVDGEVFVEARLDRAALQAGAVEVEWEGRKHRLPLDAPAAGVLFRPLPELDDGRMLVAVLVRRRGPWEWIRSLMRGGKD
jgi:hypothetical protein